MDKKYLFLGIIIIAVIGGFFLVKIKKGENVPVTNNDNKENVENSVTTPNITLSGGNGTVFQVLDQKEIDKIAKPDLHRTVSYNQTLPADFRAKLESNIAAQIALIEKQENPFAEWVQLGVMYKVAGDYNAARDAWEYVTKVDPYQIAAYSNLGDLYHHFVVDYPKAEYNLAKVVSINPHYVSGYINLYDLYANSYLQNTNKAEETLKNGLANNKSSTDLMIALAEYYEKKGQNDLARKYYTDAKTEAKALGNDSLVKMIEDNLSKLPK